MTVPRVEEKLGTAATGPLLPQGSSVTTRVGLSPGMYAWLGLKAVSAGLFVSGHVTWGVLAYLLLDPWLLWTIGRPAARGFGPVASRFATDRREVWLTIDDGPDPESTPRILDLLEKHGARATFFAIGQNVDRHPELAREIVKRGHMIANHTHRHPCWTLWRTGPRAVGEEIDRCNEALHRAGVSASAYFRVPVGIKTPFVFPALARRGMSLIAWSARGFDAISEAAPAAQRIVKAIRPGAIVLLHEGPQCRAGVRVVELVLEHLQREGYTAIIPAPQSLR